MFLEEKRGDLHFKRVRKVHLALSWPKRDEKDYLKSERKMAGSAASHNEKRDICDIYPALRYAESLIVNFWASRPVKFLTLIKMITKNFLNELIKAGKENEFNVGSRMDRRLRQLYERNQQILINLAIKVNIFHM